MDGSPYELELIDDLLNGQLTRNMNPSKNRLTFINYLSEKYSECQIVTILEFKKRNNSYKILSRKNISAVHPLFGNFRCDQVKLFSIATNLSNFQEFLASLEIPIENIVNFNQQNTKSNYKLSLFWNSSWEAFNDGELKYYYINSIVEDEKYKICKVIKSKILNSNDDKSICNYLLKLKQQINYLSVDILRKFNLGIDNTEIEIKDDYQEKDFYIVIHALLVSISDFIEVHYNDCLNREFTISSKSFKLKFIKLQERANEINDFFLKTNISKELRKIVFSPFENTEAFENNTNLSLNKFHYLDFYTLHLCDYFNNCTFPNHVKEQDMIDLLYELNYNNLSFVNFVIAKIKDNLAKIKSPAKRKDLVCLEIKNINQIFVRTKKQLIENNKSLKQLILDWLKLELNFLNNTSPIFDNSNLAAQKTTTSPSEKIKINVSVSTGIMFTKLMHSVGLFKDNSLKEIHKTFSETFQTVSKNDISVKSMRNKHYADDPKDIEENRKMLLEMLANLDDL